MKKELKRISFNPSICHGRATVTGTRITVAAVLDSMAEGSTEKEILENYPGLKKEDIKAALHYASSLAREEVIA
ncbi:MAG: DUF433 domain-containing protein [Candidatus Diapherotrites archaeon]|nr:DUF433 domain-containing protein [Candidatus Diapherotrites archaeon]